MRRRLLQEAHSPRVFPICAVVGALTACSPGRQECRALRQRPSCFLPLFWRRCHASVLGGEYGRIYRTNACELLPFIHAHVVHLFAHRALSVSAHPLGMGVPGLGTRQVWFPAGVGHHPLLPYVHEFAGAYVWGECSWNEFGMLYYYSGYTGYLSEAS